MKEEIWQVLMAVGISYLLLLIFVLVYRKRKKNWRLQAKIGDNMTKVVEIKDVNDADLIRDMLRRASIKFEESFESVRFSDFSFADCRFITTDEGRVTFVFKQLSGELRGIGVEP